MHVVVTLRNSNQLAEDRRGALFDMQSSNCIQHRTLVSPANNKKAGLGPAFQFKLNFVFD